MTKTLTAIAVAATLAIAAVAAPQSAEARSRGGAVAAGVIGGLAAGAIIGSQMNRNDGGYYASSPGYAPRCYTTRQRVWTDYGWRTQRVRVCD